jgi:hypothetical protein
LATTLPSSPLSPDPTPDDHRDADGDHVDSFQASNNLASTVTTQTMEQVTTTGQNSAVGVEEEHHDHTDDRSSSLSELEDGIDDHEDADLAIGIERKAMDVDSETETERLERTPRKPNDADASISAVYTNNERSPSKLAQEILPGDSSSSHRSPLSADVGSSSRKRKRPSSEASSLSDPELEKPVPKRSHPSQDCMTTNDAEEPQRPEIEPVDSGEKQEEEEEARDKEEIEVEANIDDVDESHVAPVTLPAPSIRTGKGKKGKRKGRKPFNSEVATDTGTGDNSEDVPDVAQAQEEADEGESSSFDEERKYALSRPNERELKASIAVAKKKAALEALSTIEKQFLPFREK